MLRVLRLRWGLLLVRGRGIDMGFTVSQDASCERVEDSISSEPGGHSEARWFVVL